MKLNSKVTGGLAWAGLVLILAVPSAEMLSKPSAFHADTGSDAGSTAAADETEVDAVKTATVVAPKPATRRVAPAAGATKGDVVEAYVASGKKLPSYISDAPGASSQPAAPAMAASKPPAAPAATVKLVDPSATAAVNGGTSAAADKITTASVDTVRVTPPPIPYPASMRPASRPAATATADRPLVIDDESVARRQLAVRTVEPFLVDEPRIIEGEELEEWDSGSLADYLERRGLISGSDQAARDLEREFDEDGFFLSDGPNSRRRLVGRPVDDWQLF